MGGEERATLVSLLGKMSHERMLAFTHSWTTHRDIILADNTHDMGQRIFGEDQVRIIHALREHSPDQLKEFTEMWHAHQAQFLMRLMSGPRRAQIILALTQLQPSQIPDFAEAWRMYQNIFLRDESELESRVRWIETLSQLSTSQIKTIVGYQKSIYKGFRDERERISLTLSLKDQTPEEIKEFAARKSRKRPPQKAL